MRIRFQTELFPAIAIIAAATTAMVGFSGCCKAPEPAPAPATIDEAWDLAISIATNVASGADDGEWVPEAPPLPTAEDARTNLASRFTLQLKDNAAKMADLTKRRAEALDAARGDPAFEAAYAEAVAARKRYDDLVSAHPSIREIDEELARLRRERGALLRGRERFEGKSFPKKVSK